MRIHSGLFTAKPFIYKCILSISSISPTKNKSVTEYFFQYENCLEGSEFEYFERRLLLIYLMKSGQSDRIKDIKSPLIKIKEML